MAERKKNKKNWNGGEFEPKLFTGKLELTRSGIGFVIVEGLKDDILVESSNLGTALNGDEVKVEVKQDGRNNKRFTGRILEVIRRKQTEFSGMVEVHQHFAFLIPESKKMPLDIYIPLHLLNGAKNGEQAMARIVEWSGKTKNPVGEIISILTNQSINDIAMQDILTEGGFPLTFSEEVIEEAARINDVPDNAELKKRRDFRDVLTMTIDPADAKDFDDALSFQPLKGGWYEVGVHIADVSHYIVEGTPLDIEAYRRATSVYLPDRVLPMLPERLSNELCSLRPNEDKFTFSVVFKINKKGRVSDKWYGKTIIHSNRRFSYEEVQGVIESGSGDHAKEILLLNEMAQNLRAERFLAGAINFSSQEVKFVLDETGKPINTIIKESKEAHQLIEEFMLLANRNVAEYVSGINFENKPVPFPYRVHDAPNEDKLKLFAVYAARFGIVFDLTTPKNIAKSFNKMLEAVTGKSEQHVLEQLGIRTMAKAVYTTDNIGHYGLGFENYCHFTSPIRRYPDVLVHRILNECLEKKMQPVKHLEAQCRHCTDQEKRAMEAERAANKYKQVELMQDFIGEDFESVISGVSSFGFWAETILHKCEGLVPISDLREIDSFVYKESEYALIGISTGLRFTMGDKIMVKLVATNLEKRQMDFSFVELIDSDIKVKRKNSGKTKKNN